MCVVCCSIFLMMHYTFLTFQIKIFLYLFYFILFLLLKFKEEKKKMVRFWRIVFLLASDFKRYSNFNISPLLPIILLCVCRPLCSLLVYFQKPHKHLKMLKQWTKRTEKKYLLRKMFPEKMKQNYFCLSSSFRPRKIN